MTDSRNFLLYSVHACESDRFVGQPLMARSDPFRLLPYATYMLSC